MFSYKSKKWEHKRKAILQRDGHLCQVCKKYGYSVEANTVHHIKPVEFFPELAWDDNNLISLCAGCHNKAHPERNKKWHKMGGKTRKTNLF